MGKAGCEAAWLKSQSVCDRVLQNRRRHSLPPSGVAPAGELGSASCMVADDWLRQFELSAVFQHRVHDDGEPSGERDPGFSHGGAPGDGEGPILELQRSLAARQDHIRRFIEQPPHPPVATFRDAAGVVDLARLVSEGHEAETGADIARSLEAFGIVDRRGKSKCRQLPDFHVVENPAPRHPAEHTERLGMGVEQHLMGLQQIGADEEGAAVGQLDMGDLQLDPLAADDRPILAPIELECLARLESQRNESVPANRLLFALPVFLPVPGEGRDAAIGAVKAQRDQIGVQLLQRALLLARTLPNAHQNLSEINLPK